MEKQLLKAATNGDIELMKLLASRDLGVLLGRTPQENTCLHIAAIHGHEDFCNRVLGHFTDPSSLLNAVNLDGETPLLTAATNGRDSLVSSLLRHYRSQQMKPALLRTDRHGCNALHHAIRGGHKELARELIGAEPELSGDVNKNNESPMFIAVLRGYTDVAMMLLDIPNSAHSGAVGYNALHAAIKYNRIEIVRKIMETRPGLARAEDEQQATPVLLAVEWNKTDILRVMLEHDWTLGYGITTAGSPLLCAAAFRGHVKVAEELLKHCPDAPYCGNDGWTCLHDAVYNGQLEFVKFILRNQKLQKLINMTNVNAETALHFAIQKCDPEMVTALLDHKARDVTIVNKQGNTAIWKLREVHNYAKTLNWNKIAMLMCNADRGGDTDIYNLYQEVKDNALNESRKSVKYLTERYTSNTSLVAILITTLTFTAAFTLPGGYSNDAGSEGLPIMARKFMFKAFLVADTLAMCSSLAVAFICVILKWEDYEFLLYYRRLTQILMFLAYVATTIAFATGLYTVVAPRVLWLAIMIFVFSVLLPIITLVLGQYPILELRVKLRRVYNKKLLDTNPLDIV